MLQLLKKRDTLIILFYILLDQLVKLFISSCFIDEHYEWIYPLAFKPLLNKDYSIANSLLHLGIGVELHVILIGFALIVMITVYKYVLSRNHQTKAIALAFNLLISGSMCSMIDKLFWGGSLDYICLRGYFVFDLKDIYIIVAEIMLIVIVIIKRQSVIDFKYTELFSFINESIKE